MGNQQPKQKEPKKGEPLPAPDNTKSAAVDAKSAASPDAAQTAVKPAIQSTKLSEAKVFCKVCQKAENLKKCSRCQETVYCSKICQQQDWASHKPECNAEFKVTVSLSHLPGRWPMTKFVSLHSALPDVSHPPWEDPGLPRPLIAGKARDRFMVKVQTPLDKGAQQRIALRSSAPRNCKQSRRC